MGWIGTALLVLALVAACSPQAATLTAPAGGASPQAAIGTPQRGGTLRVGFDGEPGHLDSYYKEGAGAYVWRYTKLIYNSLTYTDAKGNMIPELAESWSSPDNKTWTFKLRKGVKFQDGTDFNAQAVKFNWDRSQRPETQAVNRNQLTQAGLTSVDVVDDYTIRFNLAYPNAAFPAYPSNAGTTAMESPAAVAKWGDQYQLHPVGTGPFMLDEWVKGDHMTLKRFDQFWRKDQNGNQLPHLDQIIIKPIPDPTIRLTALRTGNLDFVDNVETSDLPTVQGDQNLQAQTWGNISFNMIFNCAAPPFNNQALRQAVAWAVDQEALHKTLYGGLGAVARAPLHPENWGFDPQGKFYTRDLAKAKAKLAEGGKPTGFKFMATDYNTPMEVRVAQAIKGQLAEAGIDMDIVPMERQELASIMGARKIEAASFTLAYGMPEDPDVELYRNFHSKGSLNMGNCPSPDIDAALEQSRQATDQAGRKAQYAKIQALVLDWAPRVFVHHNPTISGMSKKVQGFVGNIDLTRLQFDWLWLQK